MEFLIYNVRVALLLTAFFLLYRLFLSKETFLRLNRIVILSVVAISFALPKWRISVPQGSVSQAVVDGFPTIALDEFVVSAEGSSLSWLTPQFVAVALFAAGVAFFAVRLLWAFVGIVALLRRGERLYLGGGVVLFLHDSPVAPFSWLRFVSMSRADYADSRDEILTHELAHIHLFHSLDLLALDVICCLQWFNPAMWLLRAEMCAIHEYEADKAVLDSGINAKQYQLLLIKKAAGARWSSIANSFNHSKLKNRITMMLRQKSSVWARAKVLYVLPIIGGAMIAFAQVACSESEDTQLLSELSASDLESVHSAVGADVSSARDILAQDSVMMTRVNSGEVVSFNIRNGEVVEFVTSYGETVKYRGANEPFMVCEQMPLFPGGDEALRTFLATNLVYPKEAADQSISGRVFVKFIVDEEGHVTDVHPARKIDNFLDAEAVRVVRAMPDWTPGRQRGQAVAVSYVVPIVFSLK